MPRHRDNLYSSDSGDDLDLMAPGQLKRPKMATNDMEYAEHLKDKSKEAENPFSRQFSTEILKIFEIT